MRPIVAAFDFERQQVLHLEVVQHPEDAERTWRAVSQRYPKAEVLLAVARSLDEFGELYPQYAGAEETGVSRETSPDQPATPTKRNDVTR